jgi:hypothetical protein
MIYMTVRQTQEMIQNGYMIIDFPSELSQTMIAWIREYISKISKNDQLESVIDLSDEAFLESFHKAFRIFPPSVSSLLLTWVESLADLIGGEKTGINYVSHFEKSKNPTLSEHSLDTFWRCVRPNKPDVGSAHCDYQFWDIAKGTKDEPRTPFDYHERWKIWIPLLGCNANTSLQVVPGSHLEEIPTDYLQTKNGIKPTINLKWLSKNESRFICPFQTFSNCCVLFHDKLVHRGPPNPSETLRISAELTILLSL